MHSIPIFERSLQHLMAACSGQAATAHKSPAGMPIFQNLIAQRKRERTLGTSYLDFRLLMDDRFSARRA